MTKLMAIKYFSMFSKGSIPYQLKIKQKLIQITFEQFFFQTNCSVYWTIYQKKFPKFNTD